jgi:hypothetical protein
VASESAETARSSTSAVTEWRALNAGFRSHPPPCFLWRRSRRHLRQ